MGIQCHFMVTKIGKNQLKRIIEDVGSPVFIYSEEAIRRNLRRVREAISNSGIRSIQFSDISTTLLNEK